MNNIKILNDSFPRTIDVLNSSPVYDPKIRKEKINLLKKLLLEKDAKIIAHYYTHEDIQEVAAWCWKAYSARLVSTCPHHSTARPNPVPFTLLPSTHPSNPPPLLLDG